MASAFDEAMRSSRSHTRDIEAAAMPHHCTLNMNLPDKIKFLDQQNNALQKKIAQAKRSGNFSDCVEAVEAMNEVVASVRDELDTQIASDPSNRVTLKLQKDFIVFLKTFEGLNEQLVRQSHDVLDRDSSFSSPLWQQLQQQQVHDDRTIDEYIAEERLKESEEIAKKTYQINALFMDVKDLVEKQGHQIQQIDTQVENTEDAVTQGMTHLKKAVQHQQSTNKCLIYFAIFLVLVS